MANDDLLGGKRVPRITPHDDEDDREWKKDLKSASQPMGGYIVYPHPSWTKETREEMKNKYGFKWLGDRWFRKEPIAEDLIDEMVLKNIIIEEGE